VENSVAEGVLPRPSHIELKWSCGRTMAEGRFLRLGKSGRAFPGKGKLRNSAPNNPWMLEIGPDQNAWTFRSLQHNKCTSRNFKKTAHCSIASPQKYPNGSPLHPGFPLHVTESPKRGEHGRHRVIHRFSKCKPRKFTTENQFACVQTNSCIHPDTKQARAAQLVCAALKLAVGCRW